MPTLLPDAASLTQDLANQKCSLLTHPRLTLATQADNEQYFKHMLSHAYKRIKNYFVEYSNLKLLAPVGLSKRGIHREKKRGMHYCLSPAARKAERRTHFEELWFAEKKKSKAAEAILILRIRGTRHDHCVFPFETSQMSRFAGGLASSAS